MPVERSGGGSTGGGIGLGSVIAAVLSYSVNKSIGWAILHGIFSWFYVIYYACGGGR